jgi:biopolymer transport protein ExbB
LLARDDVELDDTVIFVRCAFGAMLALALMTAPMAALAQNAQPAPVTTPAATAADAAPTGDAATPPVDPATGLPFDPARAPDAHNATLPQDLSPWGMFMQADWVVKAVMIGLAFASIVTWTVWLAKSLELAAAAESGAPEPEDPAAVGAWWRRAASEAG